MGLLAQTKTNVVHNPESNMNNAVGCARVIDMFKKGVLVGLGTDGMTSDMFRESKAANIIHKHANKDPRVGFVETCKMLIENNPKIASKLFTKKVGVLEIGAYADIIISDYKPPTPLRFNNFGGHLLFGLSAGDVATTIASGRVLMKDRRLVGIDEEKITAKSKELAQKLWKRI
jgi:cytosine/adenosine deaminase-related metal-dependent hydrolase